MKSNENHLKGQKSPYLLQHLHNPVDWYPWGEEAFQKAERENKPIFLSIGYSTCHWCHVMERESFEDREVADAMNRVFISIKVDREERPDVDSAYMTACQVMTGSGGWPLNLILTPDRKPVFAFTYIPKESRHGNVGMIDLCRQVNELWTEGKENMLSRGDEVLNAINRATSTGKRKMPGGDLTNLVFRYFESSFDRENGGFGGAPKFPSPHNLLFLVDRYARTGDGLPVEMVEKTLKHMKMGGIFDHIGYGFHRYSTDPSWILPHFEKMIYDQAMLMMAYSEAYAATGNESDRKTALQTGEFLRQELLAPEGAFYSALDADSEGEEGKYYTWTYSEIMGALGEISGDLFTRFYNVERSGNFLEESTGRSLQKNILYETEELKTFATENRMTVDELEHLLEEGRKKLLKIREKRVRPHLDDKILTDMNGLMIGALCISYRRTGEKYLLDMAKSAADFIRRRMYSNGHLLHRFREDEASINGFLDDYAFTIFGMIELYVTTFDPDYLEIAVKLQETLDSEFLDASEGAYFQSSERGEKLFTRTKESHDGAIPGGNSMEIHNLVRLSRMISNPNYRAEAEKIAELYGEGLEKVPSFHSFMALGIARLNEKGYLIKIWGSSMEKKKLLDEIWKKYHPDIDLVVLGEKGDGLIEKSEMEGVTDIEKLKGEILACTDLECLAPSRTSKGILEAIRSAR